MVLEARLLEGVAEASLWVDLTVEEEEEQQLSDPAWVVVVVQNCHLSGTVSLSLAEDYEDAVCTKTAVCPARNRNSGQI